MKRNLFISFVILFLVSSVFTVSKKMIDENSKKIFPDTSGMGITFQNTPILLVSDQTDGVDTPEYYDSYYINAVESGGYGYGVWDHDILGSPSYEDLENFSMVIWYTGISGEYSADNEIYGNITLTPSERFTLANYLMETEGDRTLVLSGMWIAWNCVADAGNETQLSSLLFSSLLGLDYHQDNFTNWIEVQDDWCVEGAGGVPVFPDGDVQIEWRASGNFPDQLESVYGNETALWKDTEENGYHYGIIYNTITKADGVARIVLMSCPLEAIETSDDRTLIIEEICDWSGIDPVSIETSSLGKIKNLFFGE